MISPLSKFCKWVGTIIVVATFLVPSVSFAYSPFNIQLEPFNFYINNVGNPQTTNTLTTILVNNNWATYTTGNFDGLVLYGLVLFASGNNGSPYNLDVSSYPDGHYMMLDSAGDLLFFQVISGVIDNVNFPIVTGTHIVDFTPEASTTPISNPVTFSLHAYVSPSDIGNFVGIQFTLQNVDQNTLLSEISPYTITFLDGFQATSSGDFYYSSTTSALPNGNYRIDATLTHSYLGGIIINPFSAQNLSHSFIIGSSTFVGNFSQNGLSGLNSLFASTTATSTASAIGACNPISGNVSTAFLNTNFSPLTCLSVLFIPDAGLVRDSLVSFSQQGGTHFPIGYLTDFINILSTTTSSTLPILDITVPSGLPGRTSRLVLSLSSTTLAYIYNATETPAFSGSNSSSTESFYQVTSYYWDIIVSMCAVLYMLARILGQDFFPTGFGTIDSDIENLQ